jgi:hypothetical protein
VEVVEVTEAVEVVLEVATEAAAVAAEVVSNPAMALPQQ